MYSRNSLSLRNLLLREKSILTLYECYRAFIQGRMVRESHLCTCSATVAIQSTYRWREARLLFHQGKAARVIQSFWRIKKQRKKFGYLKEFVILLPTNVRSYQQQRY
ncbi:hypothetical protein FKM82_012986 [Ascaphus truei]